MITQFVTANRNEMTGEVKMMNLSPLTRGIDAALTTIDIAYRSVAWFRRACKLRANGIGGFPLELLNQRGDDVSELPEFQGVMRWTRGLLYRTEMNLAKYGAAYHLLESNRFGKNTTPRFIPANCVYPIWDYPTATIKAFQVSLVGGGGEIPTDRMVWVWEPNDESELQPGPSDGEAALKAAGLLYAIDEMANRYMGSGGVPITAVRVPATVKTDEREKVENWFTRFAGGFRNAFKFLVVNKETEFEQIGSEIKDMKAAELTASQRDNVAVAFGVPPTVIDGKSANYATAQSEMVGYYINTVIPEAEFLEPILNTQLYQRLGLTLRFKPDELDVMQAVQLQQAEGVMALTGGKPIISVNEGRGIIEFDDIGPRGDWQDEPVSVTPPASFAPPTVTEDLPAPDVETMRTWLSSSLRQHKAGQSPAVGSPFDTELVAASSGNAIRAIFTAHWPRPDSAPAWHERAVVALEKYNALAGDSNGRNIHE